MLFNSDQFLLGFLPITLCIYLALKIWRLEAANFSLLLASLFFYAWWDIRFLPILLISIFGNFFLSRLITLFPSFRRRFFIAGIVLNLAALAYFKYANFLILNLDAILHASWSPMKIALPIGISFFTFTQIAYLVDVYQGKAKEADPVRYGLFVTYFPHLIAGPILHHGEMMPQFAERRSRDRSMDILIGLILLSIGLFKKVVVADSVAQYSTPVFMAFDKGLRLTFIETWIGALAYTLQIYFDFSAYCDMALGISRMFGILLPINFLSPYQATSIIDFWRRWHITLSRFLRDYLYIPLGGNRKGKIRRYINLAVTMLLGGLWHGASWNFVIWGGLHGSYLVINHAYRRWKPGPESQSSRIFGWLLTFLAVVFAWVFFRAGTIDGAWLMIKTMLGLKRLDMPEESFLPALVLLIPLLGICALAPNVYSLLRSYDPGLYPDWFKPKLREMGEARSWPLSFTGGIICGLMFMLALIMISQLSLESEFLYFQF